MILELGHRPGALRLDLSYGAEFSEQVELRSPDGAVLSWPAGTLAWLRLRASGFEARWDAVVAGAVLAWQQPAAAVNVVPSTAAVQLWLQYPGDDPFVWREGKVGSACAGGAGISPAVAVPLPDSRQAVVVPLPGLPGPPGPQGPAGPAGEDGPPGDGPSWWFGHGPPGLVPGSQPGDRYLDEDTGLVYVLGD